MTKKLLFGLADRNGRKMIIIFQSKSIQRPGAGDRWAKDLDKQQSRLAGAPFPENKRKSDQFILFDHLAKNRTSTREEEGLTRLLNWPETKDLFL